MSGPSPSPDSKSDHHRLVPKVEVGRERKKQPRKGVKYSLGLAPGLKAAAFRDAMPLRYTGCKPLGQISHSAIEIL